MIAFIYSWRLCMYMHTRELTHRKRKQTRVYCTRVFACQIKSWSYTHFSRLLLWLREFRRVCRRVSVLRSHFTSKRITNLHHAEGFTWHQFGSEPVSLAILSLMSLNVDSYRQCVFTLEFTYLKLEAPLSNGCRGYRFAKSPSFIRQTP